MDDVLAENGTGHPDHAEFLNERALTQHAMEREAEAEGSARQALSVARESRDPHEEGRASALLAELLAARGEQEQALEFEHRAEEIRAALGLSGWLRGMATRAEKAEGAQKAQGAE